MNLRGLVSTRVTWVLVFELCVLTPIVSSQIQGCSMEGINLLQCLNQDNSSFTDNCCKTLRQVVQAGYNCLCSLLSPSIPLFSTPFSLPLSNCDISVPPLTLCRVLAPMPVVFPPTAASPKELTPPSAPPKNVLVPPPPPPPLLLPLPPPLPSLPPQEMLVPSNSTRNDDSTMVEPQPHSSDNAVPELCVNNSKNNQSSNGKEGTKILSLLLLLALQGFVLLS